MDQVINRIKVAEVGYMGVVIIMENGAVYRCRPTEIDTTAIHEWGTCVIAPDRLSVSWPNVGVNIEVPQIDLNSPSRGRTVEEGIEQLHKERRLAMHGIKTLETVRCLYADLVNLQRVHQAVDKGDACLVLCGRFRAGEVRISDTSAMAFAVVELRATILRVRQSLVDLGFDPDQSDPHDDEG